MPAGPRFWFSSQGILEARWGPSTSTKALGKALTMDLPPPEVDKELVQWLQQEKVAAEKAWLRWDAAALEVVIEAAGPLTQGQLEGLAGPF